MVILIPALFIVLIFVLVQVFGTAPRRVKGTVKNTVLTKSGTGAKNEIDWQIPEPYPAALRDPMQLARVTTPTAIETGQLTVTGILYSEENPSSSSASINGQPVYEGEKILGATVIKINKDSVEFEMNGKKWTQRVQR